MLNLKLFSLYTLMKIIINLILILNYIYSQRPLITKEAYNLILNQSDWEPFPIEENIFYKYDISKAKKFLGLISLIPNITLEDSSKSNVLSFKRNLDSYDNFDGREKWKCVDYIDNQLKCGSSWAFAITNVLSDRLCIMNTNKKTIKLSVYSKFLITLDLLTCDFLNYGCKGGTTISGLIHLINHGVALEVCQNIKFKNVDLICEKKCQNSRINYQTFKIDKGSLKRLTGIKQIKDDIFENGPLYAEMIIYEDFFHYKRGIYSNVINNPIGYHAVRV